MTFLGFRFWSEKTPLKFKRFGNRLQSGVRSTKPSPVGGFFFLNFLESLSNLIALLLSDGDDEFSFMTYPCTFSIKFTTILFRNIVMCEPTF